jgi:hypothetical protein
LVPARDAKENRLAWSIPLVDRSTARAALARVSWIDGDNWHSSALGFVFQECAELAEGPVGQAIATAAAGRDPSANVRQFLDGNSAPSAFGIGHNILRNAVIGVLLEPRLLAGEFDKTTLRRLGSALLKTGAAVGEVNADALYVVAVVNLTVARGGDSDNSHIDAEPVGCFEPFGFWNVTGASEHPLAAHEAQIDLSLTEGEKVTLMLAGDKADFHSAFDSPDRNRIVATKAEDAVVIGLRGERAEDRSDIAIDFEGVRYLGNAANGGLRRQREVSARVCIGQLVQIKLPENASSKPLGGNRRASLIAADKCRLENGGLLACGQEFDGGDEFHTLKYRSNPASIQVGSGAFLPGLKAEVSSAENR